jgi:MHS family proline/betaine transporter-like MFS transporter
MVQGISSMGEVSGANLYITEITNPPVQYSAVMTIAVTGVLGGFCALGVASLVTLLGFNWRLAFWIGAGIACIGAFARTRLRETPDFTNAKLRIKRAIQKTNQSIKILDKNLIWNEKVKIRTALSLFFVECSWPVCFYFAYMYCGTILKNSFGFSPAAIIHQNLVLSAIQLFSWGILMYITYYIHPLRILKIRLVIFLIFLLFCPYLLDHATSANTILLVQSLFVVFGLMGIPAMPIFYKQLPVFKRFTYTTFAYAISRAFIYVVSSFGLEYVMRVFGNYGLLIIVIPTSCFFIYAINYFQSEVQEAHHHY